MEDADGRNRVVAQQVQFWECWECWECWDWVVNLGFGLAFRR